MNDHRADRPPMQQTMRFLASGELLILKAGECPSLKWVDSYAESVPREYWEDYLRLRRERVALEDGPAYVRAAWLERWSAFDAILGAIGRTRNYAMVVGQGRIESIEPG